MKPIPLLLILVLNCLPFFQQELQAQIKYRSLQKVYLSNGWVLRGDTSHVKEKKSLKIITPDRQEFLFPLQKVDSIVNAKFRSSRKSEAGSRNIVQIGYLLHNPEPAPGVDPNLLGNYYSLSLQYIRSYTSESGPSIGMGSGINLFSRGYVMPLFVDIRGDLGMGLIRPHLYGQIGTSIPLYGRETLLDFWGNPQFQDFDADGGILIEAGAGLKFLARENYAWSISIGWRIQKITEAYKQWEIRYKDEYSFQRISLQAGYMF